jgi:glycosyltransferase involved in cell wall biosynthesis
MDAEPIHCTGFRIAMVAACPFPYPQGSQVLIAQLSAALRRRGHGVRLVAYHAGVGQAPPGLEILRTPALPGRAAIGAGPSSQKPLLDLLLARELLRLVRRWPVDLIHTHNFEGLLAALAVRRRTGVPVVYHVHNAMGPELHTYFRSRLGRWAGGLVGRWVDAHLPLRADFNIVLDEGAVDYFQLRGVDRLQVIPPGIDFEPGEAARARQALGDGPLVVYSGNLDRYQDLDLLLDAFRLVVVARPDARLVLSTSGEPGDLQARAKALGIGGATLFLPAVDFGGVRDLLAAADVAVCPRQVCLGFPIKLLNYMAAGRAIVASTGSACGLRHMDNGWVVQDGDTAGMAAAILALLDDPGLARQLGKAAQRAARHDYTWDRAVDAIEGIYNQLGQAGNVGQVGNPAQVPNRRQN